jgi:ABC-type dipeptide/oligopeptide/nickel transport system permease component
VSDLLIFIPLVAVVLVAGIGLGMLGARRLGRLIDHDEEPGDD